MYSPESMNLAFIPPPAHIVSNKTVPKCSALGSQYLSQDDTRMIIQLRHFLNGIYDKLLKVCCFCLINLV